MDRWLLNNLTTWELGLLIVGGTAVVGVAGLLLVRRFVPDLVTGDHTEAAAIVLGVLAGVYGIILGFVIVVLYEDLRTAKGNVRTEATALAQVYRDTQGLRPPASRLMREEIAAYAASVQGDEWRAMRDGHESANAWRHVSDMFHVLQRFEPRTQSETAFYQAAVGKLDDLVSARRQRLSSASEGLPGTFQILLLVGAGILIIFFYLVRAPGLRTQVFIVTAVATMISFNLLVALVLEYPFSGQVAVSSSPFSQGALAEITGGAPHGK